MKTIANTLYLIFGCAVMISSCRQEDVPAAFPDGSDKRIVFHTSLPDLTTKAGEIAADLAYFRLTAYDESDGSHIEDGKLTEYADSVRLEKAAGSEKFVSDLCVWPNPGQEDDLLHFFAYYPELPVSASLANNTAVSDGNVTIGHKINGYSISEEIADQTDFVTAYAAGTMNDHLFDGINLKFRHQLSRVEVKAKGSHKSCAIEIAGVRFGNAVMQGDFEFQTSDSDGVWTETSKKDAEYIFREGDAIVTVGADPVSIMGSKIDADNENCAMLIPSSLTAWAYDTDANNGNEGLYLNVLLRVIDATNTSGRGEQRYPYSDNSQGLNALNIPVQLFTVDNEGKVIAGPVQVYKDEDGKYYTDPEKANEYNVPEGSTVKEFGWAAVPISGEWEAGKIYTYTLDYTYGVGVHGPEAPGEVSPKAGDPIISDMVGVSMGVKSWQSANPAGVTVPGN